MWSPDLQSGRTEEIIFLILHKKGIAIHEAAISLKAEVLSVSIMFADVILTVRSISLMARTPAFSGQCWFESSMLYKIEQHETAGRILPSEIRKNSLGTRQRKKYSDNFNEIFSFFLTSYRSGILTFCGSQIDIDFDINGPEGKLTFKEFENGKYKINSIITRHPNIIRGVITGKKSWGLWLNQWTDGIVEGSFTKKEILNEFDSRRIKIPQSLLDDFNNRIYEKQKLGNTK